ncbi:hypothetical protein [Lactobacillus sp.]|uniref:hypothetical protein n=1 Tax=Lactobacillus sp. TaxID=1591 RepID=UPI003EF1D2F6
MDIHSWWVPYAVLLFGIWDLVTGISRAIKAKKGEKTKGLSSSAFIILGVLFIITGIWSFWA